MEHTLPFDQPGRFWRGNLHTHSTESDGLLSPERVCQFYRDEGYDFLSITDHFLPNYDFPITDTRAYQTKDFITLPGAELHTPGTTFDRLWHLLAVGLPHDFAETPEGETGPELARRALDTGAFVAVAHPAWYHLTEEDIVSLGPDLHAIETYNGTSTDHNDAPSSWHIYDVMLGRGYRYNALATDDAHFQETRLDSALGWVWVKSETLTQEAILTALKAGYYYSSTGPRFHDIQVQDDCIMVRCSPVERIMVSGIGHKVSRTSGRGMIEAEIPLKRLEGSPYCRITIRAANGGRAWSNPIWL